MTNHSPHRKPPRVSFQPSEDQHDFLEGIRSRHGIPKSRYIASLIKAEMEKEEDRLRPILHVLSSHEMRSSGSTGGTTSPSLPPVPVGTNLSDISAIATINAEVKKLIANGRIKKTRAWKPKTKKT